MSLMNELLAPEALATADLVEGGLPELEQPLAPDILTIAEAAGSILVAGYCPKTNRICLTPRKCNPFCKKMKGSVQSEDPEAMLEL